MSNFNFRKSNVKVADKEFDVALVVSLMRTHKYCKSLSKATKSILWEKIAASYGEQKDIPHRAKKSLEKLRKDLITKWKNKW